MTSMVPATVGVSGDGTRRRSRRPRTLAEGIAAQVFLRPARMELFEEITRLPEYYLTRAERRL
jgi:hypothetical protein